MNENLIHQCIIIARAYRLAANRQFIHWTCSRLGRGTCRVVPSCIVAAVCHEIPEADGVYTGFKLAELYIAHIHITYTTNIFSINSYYIQYLNNYNLTYWALCYCSMQLLLRIITVWLCGKSKNVLCNYILFWWPFYASYMYIMWYAVWFVIVK